MSNQPAPPTKDRTTDRSLREIRGVTVDTGTTPRSGRPLERAATPPGPVTAATIGSQVTDELRRRILSGVYGTGDKLHQASIAEELGVSRIPVREALRQLNAEGLVVLVSQKGARVASLSSEEVRELFEVRACMEPYVLRLSIPRLTDGDLADAARVIDEMKKLQIETWGVLNWRLHRILYQRCERPTILAMLDRIHESIDRFLRLQITISRDFEQAHADHGALLELCRDRRADAAAALLHEHILNVTEWTLTTAGRT